MKDVKITASIKITLNHSYKGDIFFIHSKHKMN